MEKAKFIIESKMEKKDVKKFIYIATFLRNRFIFPILIAIALVGSLIINLGYEEFNILSFVIQTLIMFTLSIVTIIFLVERRNKKRIQNDKTGALTSTSTLYFYEEDIKISNKALEASAEIKYEQFHQLLETKEYYIFYFTVNQASLIRKEDVQNPEEFSEFLQDKFSKIYRKI